MNRLRSEGIVSADNDSIENGDQNSNTLNEDEIRRRAKNAINDEFNPYEIFDIEIDTTMTQIRKTYKKLSLQLHPDKIKDAELKELASIAFMDVVAA